MGLWNKFFGKPTSKGPEKSPYLPKNDDPLDIRFAENFTANGGFFLYSDSLEQVQSNYSNIYIENGWEQNEIVTLNPTLAQTFQTSLIDSHSSSLHHFKALLIECEFLIGNTGKILLSSQQIHHFKLNELPQTLIITANIQQLTLDLSEGMTLLKNKYKNSIPTNITSPKIKSEHLVDNKIQNAKTSSKNIYLLLEDF